MLRFLIIVSGAVEVAFGLSALVVPNVVIDILFGTGADATAIALTRVLGAATLALGAAALLARNDLRSTGGLSVAYCLTAYNLLAAVLLAWAAATGLGGTALLVAASFHALMGAALTYALAPHIRMPG